MTIADAASVVDGGVDGGRRSMRIATLNTRCLVDDWELRRPILVSELVALQPDVIAMQELCREGGQDSLDELLDALTEATGQAYSSARADTHIAWDQYQEGIALVARVPIRIEAILDLPEGVFPRRAIVARFESDVASFLLAATHLSFGDQVDTRMAQLAAIRSALDDRRAIGEVTIIAGDLNEGPDGAAVSAAIAAGYVDTWSELHPGDPGYTSPVPGPTQRIDHILVHPGETSIGARHIEHFVTEPVDGVRGSDHYGVWADLE